MSGPVSFLRKWPEASNGFIDQINRLVIRMRIIEFANGPYFCVRTAQNTECICKSAHDSTVFFGISTLVLGDITLDSKGSNGSATDTILSDTVCRGKDCFERSTIGIPEVSVLSEVFSRQSFIAYSLEYSDYSRRVHDRHHSLLFVELRGLYNSRNDCQSSQNLTSLCYTLGTKITLHTSKGDIGLEMMESDAPNTVANFVAAR